MNNVSTAYSYLFKYILIGDIGTLYKIYQGLYLNFNDEIISRRKIFDIELVHRIAI
jgi:hypothetical protein